MKTLYFYKDRGIPMGIGIKPAFDEDKPVYDSLNRKLSIQSDLCWHERRDMQNVIAKADFWGGFPFDDCQLVAAEIYLEIFMQRIDFLYLTNEGKVQVCELKLGGKEKDTVGQLFRYIEELSYHNIDLNWIKSKAAKYRAVSVDSFKFKFDRHCKKLITYIHENDITSIELDECTAAIIDEDPDHRALLGAQGANRMGKDIHVYSMEMLSSDNWALSDDVQYLKLNIRHVDINKALISVMHAKKGAE
ncbi:MAG: hypothetical protein GF388_00135 [Candidatus Aegiribacteria sp.]|nr:hypothetical protein [Candidatus Aegiribacteria sp.]